jgi:hypothetical protein
MQMARRSSSSLIWSFGIILLTLTTQIVCAGHPETHHVTGPPLCHDSSSLAVQWHGKPILFADGRVFPLSPKSPILIVPPLAVDSHPSLGLGPWTHHPSQMQENTPATTPQSFLPVLRL